MYTDTLGDFRGTSQNYRMRTLLLFQYFLSLLQHRSLSWMLGVCNSLSVTPADNPLHRRGTASGPESITGKGVYEKEVTLSFSCIYFNGYHLFTLNVTGLLLEDVT